MCSLRGGLMFFFFADGFPELHFVLNFPEFGNPGYAADDDERYHKAEDRV